jgi:uncharacterized protein
MSIKQKILTDLKEAMKSGETTKRDTLRMVDSMIKNVEIEKKKKDLGLDDKEVQEVIARAIKQRKDAVEQYQSGGREELAQKEQVEIEILLEYMPKQLSQEEIKKVALKEIKNCNASSKSEIGKVMGAVMTKLKGKADGKDIRNVVEQLLS